MKIGDVVTAWYEGGPDRPPVRGRVLALFDKGFVWEADEPVTWRPPASARRSGFAFSDEGSLWLAGSGAEVTNALLAAMALSE